MTLEALAAELYDTNCLVISANDRRLLLLFVRSFIGKDGKVLAFLLDVGVSHLDLGSLARIYPDGFGVDYIDASGNNCVIAHDDLNLSFALDESRAARYAVIPLEPQVPESSCYEVPAYNLQAMRLIRGLLDRPIIWEDLTLPKI
jgi:hypothetical protein